MIMLVLISPKVGTAGFIGRSLIGGKDFLFANPDEGTIKPKLVTGQYEIFGEYKFPDTADTQTFSELLDKNTQGYTDKDGDYSEWFKNQVHFTASSYLAELEPTVKKSKK